MKLSIKDREHLLVSGVDSKMISESTPSYCNERRLHMSTIYQVPTTLSQASAEKSLQSRSKLEDELLLFVKNGVLSEELAHKLDHDTTLQHFVDQAFAEKFRALQDAVSAERNRQK
jgi:hypothetical protein